MSMLNHDSPIHRTMSLIADVAIVGILWTLTSLLLFTIGASTTAAYYVLTKRVSGRESYIFKDYFKSFLGNLVKSTIIWVILVVFFILLLLSVSLVEGEGIFNWVTLIVNYFLILQVTFIFVYIFPLIARFESSIPTYFKQAAFLANRHIFTTVANLLILLMLIFLSAYLHFLILFVMGIYCYVSSILVVKILKKHRPDFDPVFEQEFLPFQIDEEFLDFSNEEVPDVENLSLNDKNI